MRDNFGWLLVSAGFLVACGGDDDFPAGYTDSANSSGGSGGATPSPSAGGSGGVGGSTAGQSGDGGGGSGGSSSGGAAGSSGAAGEGPEPAPVPGTEGFNCGPPAGEVPVLHLADVADGFTEPLLLTFAPGDPRRLFIVEQRGRIRVIEDGAIRSEPFLDLTDRVEHEGHEQGLLGLAFHPDYADNGRFFVNYTALPEAAEGVPANATMVVEFTVSGDPNVAAAATDRVVLMQEQPTRTHNGGMLAFGPDGFLYIGTGDGGGANDPDDNAQNPASLLGKILRIDVDAADAGEYGIPSGNMPSPARPEVFHMGLRNPWRYSFDGCRGDLYIGDVGQNDWEELNVVPHGVAHLNFGWKVCEGLHVRGGSAPCEHEEFTPPILEYGRRVGNAITGGYVYRGSLVPSLRGTYFFGDYPSQSFFAFQYVNGEVTNARELTDELDNADGNIASFGQDHNGEVYVVRRSGLIQRIEAAP